MSRRRHGIFTEGGYGERNPLWLQFCHIFFIRRLSFDNLQTVQNMLAGIFYFSELHAAIGGASVRRVRMG